MTALQEESGTLFAANSTLISWTMASRLMLGNLWAARRMCRYSRGRLSSLMPVQGTCASLIWICNLLVPSLQRLLVAELPGLNLCA